jgi:hypothetical protein
MKNENDIKNIQLVTAAVTTAGEVICTPPCLLKIDWSVLKFYGSLSKISNEL